MRLRLGLLLLLVGVLAIPAGAAEAGGEHAAGTPSIDATATSAQAWQRVHSVTRLAPTLVAPLRYAEFALDTGALRDVLARAPGEAGGQALTVAIPSPDGDLQRFAIAESMVLQAGLAARHPQITTYAGRGIDDPAATVRFSVTPLGFSASVFANGYAWYVDPHYRGDSRLHVAYHRAALPVPAAPHIKQEPIGPPAEHSGDAAEAARVPDAVGVSSGDDVPLRIYRLAFVTDPAYAQNSGAADGLDASASDYAQQLNERVLAAKTVLMNRINHVYETDFGIRMLLIDATDKLNLNTPELATGPNGPCGAAACFTASQVGGCSSGLLTRNTYVAGVIAGARNYDIGHIGLGVNGGGIAGLSVVGKQRKAEGCTGLPRPVGDFFAIDYVAHEMGHQFGGNHTFNGTQGSCAATNRHLQGTAAVEPGSGSSVMAYAGICGVDDLQAHSDPFFSQASIREMNTYVASAPQSLSSVQQVVLSGFDGSDSLTLNYGDATATEIVRGTSFTAAAIQTALNAILPDEGTATVANVSDAGFQVTFGGGLASSEVELLGLSLAGATGHVGETVSGGPTTQGGALQTIGNHAPEVSAPAALTIPVRTPFTLTASATDPDGDTVTYLWEQNEGGLPAVGNSLLEPEKPLGPLFRAFGKAARYANPDDTYLSPSPGQNLASTDPSRSFPDVEQVAVDNTNALTGTCAGISASPSEAQVDCLSEFLPTAGWIGVGTPGVLRFRVTARDNHTGGGATAHADTVLTLAQGAGPFRVLSLPSVLPPAAGTIPVAWDVARTDVLTNTPSVRISLSTDGGKTFPHVLAPSTANDGTQTVSVPEGVTTTTGRIKVEAVGNVFFDISHSDLTIQ